MPRKPYLRPTDPSINVGYSRELGCLETYWVAH
jgi:hypothetical protein